MELHALQPGRTYDIRSKDWTAPTEEVIPGETKRRIFLGHKRVDGILFLEVRRETGKQHLIAAETIESITEVDRANELGIQVEPSPAYGTECAFDVWYQQGLSGFVARLPRTLLKQAFFHLAKQWTEAGRPVRKWQVRAFIHGSRGIGRASDTKHCVGEGYVWPTPPDPSWSLVACHYPDGEIELDFVHPVSRRFWSEDNDFLSSPVGQARLDADWYRRMGFDVLQMMPTAMVIPGRRGRHLRVIRSSSSVRI